MKNMALLLGMALVFAIGSTLVERAGFLDSEGTFVRWCTGLAATCIVMCGMQWQRRDIAARLQTLEAEFAALRRG